MRFKIIQARAMLVFMCGTYTNKLLFKLNARYNGMIADIVYQFCSSVYNMIDRHYINVNCLLIDQISPGLEKGLVKYNMTFR